MPNIYFFKSTDVSVYPCGYRGKMSNSDTIYNPQARMMTEEGLTNLGSSGDLNRNYLVDTEENTLSVVLNGYLFKIKSLNTYFSANNSYYVFIKRKSTSIYNDESHENYTYILESLDSSKNDSSNLDNSETGNFVGLGYSTQEPSESDGFIYLKVYDKGSLCQNAFLPKYDTTTGAISLSGNNASGNKSTALGYENGASGEESFVSGYRNIASGKYSAAIGSNNKSTGEAQVIVGKYSKETDAQFAVGNGKENNLNNSFETGGEDGTKINEKLTVLNETTLKNKLSVEADIEMSGNFITTHTTATSEEDKENDLKIDTTTTKTTKIDKGDLLLTTTAKKETKKLSTGDTKNTSPVETETRITGEKIDTTGSLQVGKTLFSVNLDSDKDSAVRIQNGKLYAKELIATNINATSLYTKTGETSLGDGAVIIDKNGKEAPVVVNSISIFKKDLKASTVSATEKVTSETLSTSSTTKLANSAAEFIPSAINFYQPLTITTRASNIGNIGSVVPLTSPCKTDFSGDTMTCNHKIVAKKGITADSTITASRLVIGKVSNKNTTEGGDILNVYGQVTANRYKARSDRRLKENIREYTCDNSILNLPIYKYDYINGNKNVIGCMAQDLQEICPELVSEDENGYLTIEESKIVYLLLQEVSKLKKEVAELKSK